LNFSSKNSFWIGERLPKEKTQHNIQQTDEPYKIVVHKTIFGQKIIDFKLV